MPAEYDSPAFQAAFMEAVARLAEDSFDAAPEHARAFAELAAEQLMVLEKNSGLHRDDGMD